MSPIPIGVLPVPHPPIPIGIPVVPHPPTPIGVPAHPHVPPSPPGGVPRSAPSPQQHILAAGDVVSCCLDLSVPTISFRLNGSPVLGMFENFNRDALFFPVVSFSAGVR